MEPPQERFLVHTAGEHKSLTSLVSLAKGDILCAFQGTSQPAPTRHSIQVGTTEHMLVDPVALRFINHSCEPNVAFDVRRRVVRVLRPIAPGEEFFYFYPSTEWDMAEPFRCHCRTPSCLTHIAGAKHLTPEVLARYEIQAHIRAQVPQAKRRKASKAVSVGGIYQAEPQPE